MVVVGFIFLKKPMEREGARSRPAGGGSEKREDVKGVKAAESAEG